MDRDALLEWIGAYERAWRSPGTAALEDVFAPDARYLPAPYAAPLEGREAIAAFWEAERDGPGEVFSLSARALATEDDTGVARVEVVYGDPPGGEYRDLWVVTLDAAGRCSAFEEWPFFPGQARSTAELP